MVLNVPAVKPRKTTKIGYRTASSPLNQRGLSIKCIELGSASHRTYTSTQRNAISYFGGGPSYRSQSFSHKSHCLTWTPPLFHRNSAEFLNHGHQYQSGMLKRLPSAQLSTMDSACNILTTHNFSAIIDRVELMQSAAQQKEIQSPCASATANSDTTAAVSRNQPRPEGAPDGGWHS